MTNLSKSIGLPNLRDVLDSQKTDVFDRLNCHTIGVIDSFNSTNQTAEIKIVFKTIFEGQEYSYPLLVDCPVVVIGGSGGSLRLPVVQGDHCLVLFNDVNIDNWYEGSTNSLPDSNRKHDLSDGIAMVGIRNLQNAISDYDNESAQLNFGDTKIKLTDKINMSNSTSDIKTILDNLVDVIKAIITLGSPVSHTLSPASVVALDAIKTQIATVFD
ncbi:hypothetical protein KAR91_59450 [Candidatus Pacearchaeota archaeon]|nr:hypothetical protein [Candidatus Pacearchaeota archaeon]